MVRVVLIAPPVEDFYLTRKRTLPYGLASIAATLEQAGFSSTIIDGLATDKSRPLPLPDRFSHLEDIYGRGDISHFSLFSGFRHFGYALDHLAHLARQEQPFLVGISSLFTPYSDQALGLARAVKKFCPDAWVVMGGHHPTAFPDHCLDCRDVDFVIQGEGETALSELCSFLSENRFSARTGTNGLSWSGVAGIDKLPGLAFRGDEGVICNGPAWEKDLDALPLPAVEKTAEKFYRRRHQSAVTVVASRGCPFGCTYCSVSASSSHGRFRRRSVDTVLEEIGRQTRGAAIGFIDFEDENLTLDKAWALDLLSGIRELFGEKPIELRAMNGLYPPSLDMEMLRAMKGAGFKTLNLSVGSFSPDQLRIFGRPDVRKSHETVLETAGPLGMDTVSYIIGAAPDQTPATTLSDLITLAGLPTLSGLSIFYPAPGSVAYGRCMEKGILPDQFEVMRSSALPLDQTTSRIQSATLLRLSRIINFLKRYADTRKCLPSPSPFSEGAAGKLAHRMTDKGLSSELRFDISTTLVQWFLADGIIRGMDAGQVYAHHTDAKLCRDCLRQLLTLRFMGVTTGPYFFPKG